MADALAVDPGGYQSLYRRFRPQRFAEVLGQDHVALALRNAVRDGRIGHAYLFSGPRGTGKTSTARILGKALNCTALEDGEPCGTCESCRSVAAGTSFDVHELDAASNNGVDAMRDLVARSALATPGRWKVYIVDEVHMLSTAAANALLKTLEEPPDHVVFVLATTDAPKVLPTIRSRTQHFEFHLISDEVLERLLGQVATQASLDLPEWAVSQAVRRARGSARDALSTLDQVAASGVLEEDRSDWVTGVLVALATYDEAGALVALEQAIRSGHDPVQLASDLIDELRVGFLALVSNGAITPGHDASPAGLETVRSLGTVRVVRALESIGRALVSMRDAPDPRITLEVALLRLARPEDERSLEALIERIERLERRLADGAAPTPAIPVVPVAAPEPERTHPPRPPAGGEEPAPESASRRPALGAYLRAGQAKPEPPTSVEPAAPVESVEPAASVESAAPVESGGPLPTRDELVSAWGDTVIIRLRPKVRAIFQAGRFIDSSGDTACFALPNEAHLSHAEPLRGEVAAALSAHFGKTVPLRLVVDPGAGAVEGLSEPAGTSTPPKEELRAMIEDFDSGTPAEESDGLAPSGIALAKDRLLQAFPGAEEVR